MTTFTIEWTRYNNIGCYYQDTTTLDANYQSIPKQEARVEKKQDITISQHQNRYYYYYDQLHHRALGGTTSRNHEQETAPNNRTISITYIGYKSFKEEARKI